MFSSCHLKYTGNVSTRRIPDATAKITAVVPTIYHGTNHRYNVCNHHHTTIRAAFVCLFVCLFVPYVLRGPLMDLHQTWWVHVG